jgi:cytochrome P450
LHPAFSPTGVLAYESHVDHTVTELVTHLRAVGPTANLTDWGIWFAFDTVARVAFSEDQGFMRSRTDVGGAAEASRQRFGHWNLYWAIPWLDALLYKNWWVRRSKRAPSGMARLAMRAIARRAEKDGAGADNDILGLFIRSSEKDPELYTPARIVGMTISTMQAGSETTGYTTAICLWHLLANPRVLARLRRELEDVAPTTADGWALPSASALRGTNYLEACVKESNRIRPTVNIPAEREVPAGGSTIAGVFIPGGTIVACNTAGLYTDPSIWGDDVETYRPERWLEASEEQRVKMKRADLLFITGKRMCLGLHMAWLEMRKVIPALVMNFEVRWFDVAGWDGVS